METNSLNNEKVDFPKRPLLLNLEMAYFGIGIIACLFMAYIGITEDYTIINGIKRNRQHFIINHLASVLTGAAVSAIFFFAIKNNKPWFRHVTPAIFILLSGFVFYTTDSYLLAGELISTLPVVFLIFWYFYFKKSTNEYYKKVKKLNHKSG